MFLEDLKILARTVVETEYGLFIDADIGHNSNDAIQFTSDRVDYLLEKGKCLHAEEKDIKVIILLFPS